MYDREARGPLVLIVEDEPLLRLDITMAFGAAGFSVIEVAGADEALRLLEARGNIALVFTDIEMPGRHDGLELTRIIKRRWPGIPVLVTSGRVRDVGGAGDRFFSKPYNPHEVISQARALAA